MAEKDVLDKLKKSVVEQDVDGAKAAAKQAVSENLDPVKCIDQGLAAGMNVISDQFDKAEVFVPQIIISAEAFMEAVEILKPAIKGGYKSAGKVIVHTVEGDIHDIGKNIVKILLTASGFETLDLGRDVPIEHVVDVAQEEKVDLITGSALMSTTMFSQREIVAALKERGVRDKFKTMFGGAPTTPEWIKQIGADGWAENGAEAVTVARKLLG
jgi:trimethylamine corrinoid protein